MMSLIYTSIFDLLPFPPKKHRHTGKKWLNRRSRPRAPHSETALQLHGISGNPSRPVEPQDGRNKDGDRGAS